MTHWNVAHLVDALDGIGQISREAKNDDGEADEKCHGHTHDRDPGPMVGGVPCGKGVCEIFRGGLPQELEEEFEELVVQKGGNATENADDGGNENADGDGTVAHI